MFNWFDSRKKTLPVQVLENRNDIDELKQYIAYTYGYNGELTTDTTSCPQGNTDVPNNTTYGFLIDNVGHVFKILGVTSGIVTIKYYATVTGPKGDVGQGYNEMGEWTSNNEYRPYDVVSYNGSSYVCIAEVNNSDVPPSQDVAHWTIFASGANMYELIYDIDTKNTINGTAYTSGLYTSGINIGDSYQTIPADAKRLKIYYCSYFVNNTQNGGNSNVVEMDVTNYMTEWKETCTVNSFRETVDGMNTTLFKMSVAVNNGYMNVKFFHNEELKTDGSSYIYKLEVVK